jgi:hypothetical protein
MVSATVTKMDFLKKFIILVLIFFHIFTEESGKKTLTLTVFLLKTKEGLWRLNGFHTANLYFSFLKTIPLNKAKEITSCPTIYHG